MTRLGGKVCLVTGAAQGLGRAIAHRLAAEGAVVAVADLDGARAEQVAAELTAAGRRADAHRLDVGDRSAVGATVDAVAQRHGRLDALVNSAAIFSTLRMGPFETIAPEDWDAVMRVNVAGTFFCCQAAAPHLRRTGAGSIVNVSSGTVLEGRPDYAHYVTSKAAVLGLTRALARELGADGVRVNTLLPGSVETEVPRATVTPDQVAGLIARQALHRRLQPDDIVGAVAFLVSDDAAMVTGQSVLVDGGRTFL